MQLCVWECVNTAVISWVCVRRLMMHGVINQGTMRCLCVKTWQLYITCVWHMCRCIQCCIIIQYHEQYGFIVCICVILFSSVFLKLWLCVFVTDRARYAVTLESLQCPAVWQQVSVWTEEDAAWHNPCEWISFVSFQLLWIFFLLLNKSRISGHEPEQNRVWVF